MNLDSFSLATLVIHDVPRPDSENEGLLLTNAAVGLDPQIRGYFERKITQSLRNHGLEVIADETASPVVRDGVSAVLVEDTSMQVRRVVIQPVFSPLGSDRSIKGTSSRSLNLNANKGSGCEFRESATMRRPQCSSSVT